eukprot:Skav227635  [mRNA]  locus=scaffold3692:120265:121308:+ [translate_table: standard]
MPRTSRGGARRKAAPEIDEEHLVDTFLSHVKTVGVTAAFCMGPYLHLQASQAVKGGPLGELLPLVLELVKVSPSLQYKYCHLKAAFQEVLKQYPEMKGRWPLSEHDSLPKTLADAVLVVCNHCRRITRDDTKYQEATRKLASYQVQKLTAIRKALGKEDKEPGTPLGKKRKEEPSSSRNKARKVVETPSSAKSGGTAAAVGEFDIPLTQDSEVESEDELLRSAQKAAPIPVRKAVLKEQVAEIKEMKRPAAAAKKPAAREKGEEKKKKKRVEPLPNDYKATGSLILMPYQKVGSCAIREKGGRQLLQVVSPQGLAHSKELAGKMKKMLEEGQALGKVKEWKAKKLQG